MPVTAMVLVRLRQRAYIKQTQTGEVVTLPRQRSPNRDKAYDIWKEHKGNITNRQIAEQLGENEKTIAVWKQRDKWAGEKNVVQQKKKSCTTKQNNKKSQRKKPTEIEIEPFVELVIENGELTDKQRLFCLYFTKCFNATKAYQKAYGCSYESAGSAGYRMLQNVEIQNEINQLKQAKMNRAMLTVDDIFQKYMDIAFADITDYLSFGREEVPIMTKDGAVLNEYGEPMTMMVNVVRFNESADVDGTLISEVKEGKAGVSIKLADRMKALDWLADHMDLATAEQQAKIDRARAELKRIESGKAPAKIEVVMGKAVSRFAK